MDMINPDHKCPSGFDVTTSPRRVCRRKVTPGCTSVTYSTHNIEYTRVCGRVRGYQQSFTDAFDPYFKTHTSLEHVYVDGVSITHGHPKRHIWTFASGIAEDRNDRYSCPCARSGYTGSVPSYVSNDYFCESGTYTQRTGVFSDPLWDGMGCPSTNLCCTAKNPPYFCKQVPATTNPIELRVCSDSPSSDEDILLELVEIFVQ